MVLQQISCCVVHLGDRNLKTDLGLNEIQLRLGELRLRVENKKYRFRAQFVFAFIGVETLLGEIHRHFGGFHGEFGFFQRVHGIRDFQHDALRRAAFLVLILPAADQGISEIRLRRVSPDWQGQQQRGPVGRVGEMERLIQTAAQSYVKPASELLRPFPE